MKRILALGLASAFAIPACSAAIAGEPAAPAPATAVIARVQFAGEAAVRADASGTTFKDTWDLPLTKDLARETLDKLSGALRRLSTPESIRTNLPDAKTRAALDDLLVAESYGEWRAAAGQPLDWAIAFALKPERVAVWQGAFAARAQEVQGAPAKPLTLDGATGTQADLGKLLGPVALISSGDWTVLAGGNLGTARGLLERIKTSKRPAPALTNGWFSGEFNLPKLGPWMKLARPDRWPHVQCLVAGRGGNVRVQARFGFKELALGPLAPWQIPAHTIREDPNRIPLASFSAMRGFAPWLEDTGPWKELGLKFGPSQAYIWTQPQMPFQTFYALQFPEVTNSLIQIAKNLPAALGTNIQARGTAKIDFNTNRTQVSWKGLPLLAPTLSPAPDPHYILGGFFPMAPVTNPAPAALLSQVTSRTNLLFFEWEMLGTRVPQWNVLWQMSTMVTGDPDFSRGSTAYKWLTAVGTNLTESGTEMVLESPQVISLKHTSPLGMNALAMVAITRWLDNPMFPAIDRPPRTRPALPVPQLAPLRKPKN